LADKPVVLLLNPPGDKLYIRDYYCSFSSKADYYWPPQDLIYLSGILDDRFDVHVLDAIASKICPEACFREILRLNPAAVVWTTGTATFRSDAALLDRCKAARPALRSVASAGILKFVGREILESQPGIDALLLDFGESDLIPYLEGAPGPWKSLLARVDGRIAGSDAPVARTFEVPVPRHDLFDFKKYKLPIAKRFPFTVVVTSLGCPYRCGFCTAGAFGYRIRPVENVIEELKLLARLGVREILFQDPTFTVDTRRVTALCRRMVEERFDFTWSANADLHALDKEKLRMMKEAGCHTLSVGIESGDDGMLKKYSKMITTEEIRDKTALINRHRIKVLGYFILGLPGETRASAEATIGLAKSLKLDIASFAVATPDIGTRLRAEAIEKGWISSDLLTWDSTGSAILETGGLSQKEIRALRTNAVHAFYLRPSYLLKKFLGVRSLRDFRGLVSNAFSLLRK
jgi:radical SAM superfamily enzyme YgiQ (UPF0313 family)